MGEEITARQASERYGITVSWLIRNKGKVKYRQIGPMYLFDADSVADWLATRKKRGGSEKGVPWSKKKAEASANA